MGPPGRRVPQLLRQPQIFGFADGAELGAVFRMFVQLRPAAKAGPGSEQQERQKQKADESGGGPDHWTIRSFLRSSFGCRRDAEPAWL